MRTALFVLPTDRMGGAENVVRMTAEAALADDRFDAVRVFVLAGSDTGTLDGLRNTGANITHSGARSEKGGLVALARAFARERNALTVCSHTHLNAAASAARASGLLRTDRLVTRESTMVFERDLGRIGPIVRAFYHLYGAQDRIVCQTERMAASLTEHTRGRFEAKTRHVPNPVALPPHKARTPRETERTRIVWCGRLAPVKSPERAIAALHRLMRDGTDAELVMIGDGSLRGALERQAAECGIGERVRFTGRIPNPSAEMAYAQLGLMTSDVEGFPNVILEMLAAGVRRVVTTDCAGGLADLPGVSVVSDPSATVLANALAGVRHEPADPGLAGYLEARSPAAFLEAIAA